MTNGLGKLVRSNHIRSSNLDSERDRTSRELDRVDRDLERVVQAIEDGIPALTLKDELTRLEAHKFELKRTMEQAPAPIIRLHPNLADLYSQKVANLADVLNAEANRHDASETIRSLIDEVRLVPNGDQLEIELFGELGAIINLANENPRSKETGAQVTLVAGARNQLCRLFSANGLAVSYPSNKSGLTGV